MMMFTELSGDINIQDEDGWTPLMYAAKSGSAAVVQYLLQRGAMPNMRQVHIWSIPYSAKFLWHYIFTNFVRKFTVVKI